MQLVQRICVYSSLLLFASVSMAEPTPSVSRPSVTMPKKHSALLQKYCFECHDSQAQEGEVDLEALSLDLGTIESAEVWRKVLGAINSGEMPPEDETQLAAAEKTEFLDDLSHRMVVARKLLSDQGGVITMRRLNRREYINTIRDLLGVEVDAKDLPSDANSGGFDTSGSALFVSSDQFEKYLEIGRTALDAAFAIGSVVSPMVQRREPEEGTNQLIRSRFKKLSKDLERAKRYRASDKPPTAFGFIDESRVAFEEGQYRRQAPPYEHYLKMPETKDGIVLITSFAGAMLDVTRVPDKLPAGDYVVRIRAGVINEMPQRERFLEYGLRQEESRSGEMAVLGCRYVSGTRDDPQLIEIPITLSTASDRAIGLRSRQHNNRDAARRTYQAAVAQGLPMPTPSVWIDWIEVEGPLVDAESLLPRQRILFADDDAEQSGEYARKVITRFARRAFRAKPVSPTYVERLMDLFHERRQAGESFEQAIKEPLSVILASPSFLYLREPNDSSQRRELTDMELAVRLSYFLWSAPPDAKLKQIAARGELSDPLELASQTDRMIDSPRAAEFVSGFTHQWLTMERLDFFQFDAGRFPEFDDSVKAASRIEVYQTITTLLRENLSVRYLLDSDFVVINDLLAAYYGIEDIEGHEFRKVSVPAGLPRGGLLGMAAVLAMGSDGERSSPVERGAWVMRKLLNDPPPPAPANVPQLSRLADEALPARELQKAHQEEPQCAQCHRKIDPIGFGLENFDAAGRWRDDERIKLTTQNKRSKTKDKVVAIDPSGTLPDGTPFANFDELRAQLSNRDADFAKGLTEALIEYGLGRPYGFSDEPLAQQIVDEAESEDFAMRKLIHALVQSEAFRTK